MLYEVITSSRLTQGRKPGGALRAGEEVILVSPKGEEHMVTLSPGKPFGTHKGNILHDDIIGKPDGSRVWTAMGAEYRAFRPTFGQYVMNLKRHAQIIYPNRITSYNVCYTKLLRRGDVTTVTGGSLLLGHEASCPYYGDPTCPMQSRGASLYD